MFRPRLHHIDGRLSPSPSLSVSDQCYDWPGWNPGGPEQLGISQCSPAVSAEAEVQSCEQPRQPGPDAVPLPAGSSGSSSRRRLGLGWIWEHRIGGWLQHPFQQVQPWRGRGGRHGPRVTFSWLSESDYLWSDREDRRQCRVDLHKTRQLGQVQSCYLWLSNFIYLFSPSNAVSYSSLHLDSRLAHT